MRSNIRVRSLRKSLAPDAPVAHEGYATEDISTQSTSHVKINAARGLLLKSQDTDNFDRLYSQGTSPSPRDGFHDLQRETEKTALKVGGEKQEGKYAPALAGDEPPMNERRSCDAAGDEPRPARRCDSTERHNSSTRTALVLERPSTDAASSRRASSGAGRKGSRSGSQRKPTAQDAPRRPSRRPVRTRRVKLSCEDVTSTFKNQEACMEIKRPDGEAKGRRPYLPVHPPEAHFEQDESDTNANAAAAAEERLSCPRIEVPSKPPGHRKVEPSRSVELRTPLSARAREPNARKAVQAFDIDEVVDAGFAAFGSSRSEDRFANMGGFCIDDVGAGPSTIDDFLAVGQRRNENELRCDRRWEGGTSLVVPGAIRLHTPNAHQECEGVFALLHGFYPNGYPIWKQNKRKLYLFAGLDGYLLVGGAEHAEMDFKCHVGYIASCDVHSMHMPQDLPSGWRQREGDVWVEDPLIRVRVVEAESASQDSGESGGSFDDSISWDSECSSVDSDIMPERVLTTMNLPSAHEVAKAMRVQTWG